MTVRLDPHRLPYHRKRRRIDGRDTGKRRRIDEDQDKKTYQCVDRVTVLGLVFAKMDKRVSLTRQEDEDRRVRQETDKLVRIVVSESGEEEDTEDV
jgi:hypothetical protein